VTAAEHVTVFLLRLIAEAAFRRRPCALHVWCSLEIEADMLEEPA
jgi:hypothetical protein